MGVNVQNARGNCNETEERAWREPGLAVIGVFFTFRMMSFLLSPYFLFFFFLVREMKISEVQLCLFSFMKIKEEKSKSKNVPYSVCVCMCVHACGGQRLIIGVHLDF